MKSVDHRGVASICPIGQIEFGDYTKWLSKGWLEPNTLSTVRDDN